MHSGPAAAIAELNVLSLPDHVSKKASFVLIYNARVFSFCRIFTMQSGEHLLTLCKFSFTCTLLEFYCPCSGPL